MNKKIEKIKKIRQNKHTHKLMIGVVDLKKYLYIIIMLVTILLLSVYIYGKKITQSEKVNYNYKQVVIL